LPSGLIATDDISSNSGKRSLCYSLPLWAFLRLNISSFVSRSKILKDPSSQPETINLPFGVIATANISSIKVRIDYFSQRKYFYELWRNRQFLV